MPLTGDQKREYQRKWLAARRAKGVEMLGGACIQCGVDEDLEIDHIDPGLKDISLKRDDTRGFNWSRSWDWIEKELVKCQLLCRSCHETKNLLAYPERIHGTSAMWHRGKCRCPACREFARLEKAAWRTRSGKN